MFYDFDMNLCIPHHAVFSNLLSPRLKLGLDEGHHFRLRREQGAHRGENLGQRDKRDIDGRKRNLFRNLRPRRIADIGLLETHDAIVVSQLPVELTVAHIDRIDLYGALLQHAVRKTAGRSADIHTDFTGERERELLQRLFQF